MCRRVFVYDTVVSLTIFDPDRADTSDVRSSRVHEYTDVPKQTTSGLSPRHSDCLFGLVCSDKYRSGRMLVWTDPDQSSILTDPDTVSAEVVIHSADERGHKDLLNFFSTKKEKGGKKTGAFFKLSSLKTGITRELKMEKSLSGKYSFVKFLLSHIVVIRLD